MTDTWAGWGPTHGVKVFEITTSIIRWTILPGVTVDAYAYNGQIPGSRIQIREGDHVRVILHNRLPEATTIHWHGLILPNQMNGSAEITQKSVGLGESFTYEFSANQHGTYFYHLHVNPNHHGKSYPATVRQTNMSGWCSGSDTTLWRLLWIFARRCGDVFVSVCARLW